MELLKSLAVTHSLSFSFYDSVGCEFLWHQASHHIDARSGDLGNERVTCVRSVLLVCTVESVYRMQKVWHFSTGTFHINWLRHSEPLTHEGDSCNLLVINPAVSNCCVWLLKCETPLRPFDSELWMQRWIDQLPEVSADCRALKWECYAAIWMSDRVDTQTIITV